MQGRKKTLSAEASYELAEHATDERLTPGEVNALQLIASGNANREIAAQLSIPEETVKGRVDDMTRDSFACASGTTERALIQRFLRPAHAPVTTGYRGCGNAPNLLGGKLAVWSELDSGTEIELTIPASIAYEIPSCAPTDVLEKRGMMRL